MASEFFGDFEQKDFAIDWSDYEELTALEDGWYDATIDMADYKIGQTKTNQDTTLEFHVRVRPNGGVERRIKARVLLTGKGRFLTHHLLRACGVEDFRSITSASAVARACHGKQVQVRIKKETSESGNDFNSVNGYRAATQTSHLSSIL